MLLPAFSLALLLPSAPQDDDAAFFRERVAPLLEASCLECHGGGERLKGGLWLTRREGVLEGGQSGPAVDLEKPERSHLLEMVSYDTEDHRMPPSGKLPQASLDVLTEWVRRGAPWSPDVVFEETAEEGPDRLVKGDGLEGWAYRPVTRPEVDAQSDVPAIDQLLERRRAAAGLAAVGEADRRTLIRRVTFDLTGLPPTYAEVEAFVNDDAPDAWERLVERLLASPHYGEKWGRHWLDLVRFAETNGFERDSDKPEIWRYRDWVIGAFNEDLPYDEFIRQQLAGDELDEVTHESLVATGFLRCMQWDDEPPEGRLQARYDVLDDLVSTTSEVFLATTMGCARCHDHKGDDIPQRDYASMVAFFDGLTDYKADGWLVPLLTDEEMAEHERAVAAHEAELDRLSSEQLALEQAFQKRLAERGEGAARRDLVDLEYRFYRGRYSKLPDFDMLRHEDEGTLDGGLLDLSPASRGDDFGFVFEGRLLVPHDGDYRFVLDSDDGSRVTIDGEVVVEHDRTGPLGDPQTGEVTLAAGSVPFRVDFFEWVGGEAIDLTWAPLEGLQWRYTFDAPADDWHTTDFDDSAWPVGEGGFGTEGTPGSEIGTTWNSEAVWLRRTFRWDPADGRDLVLVGHHDDHTDVYLNGVQALNLRGYITDYAVFEPSQAALASLVEGENTLAVRCEQDFGGQYVHMNLVPRHRLDLAPLDDLAFGRRQLSASVRPEGRDLAKLIEALGDDVFTDQEQATYQKVKQRREQVARQRPRIARRGNVATEGGPHPRPTHVHIRGSAKVPGDEVQPAFPSAMSTRAPVIPEPEQGARTSGRRRVLAEWITSPDNPLTARVMMNRLWQQHFGAGIVATPSDFGELGERPSHPELLDWLAAEFMERGWSVKEMHRVMLRSHAYRMASTASPDGLERDPTNQLLWRMPMRRLAAEEVRDAVIASTGQLNPKMGGPSFYSLVPKEALATASRPSAAWGRSSDAERNRRSVYIKVKRSLLVPFLTNFDLADSDQSCPERFTTTSPVQALSMLNSEFMNLRAQHLAGRLADEHPGDTAAQVDLALRLALARDATPEERDELLGFFEELRGEHGLDADLARAQLCLLIFNLNEFVYLD